MDTIVEWLERHPEAKVDKAELFGLPREEVAELPATDIHHVINYVEALSSRAAEYGAPVEVRDEFAELTQRVRDGVAAVDERGPYVQKTLGAMRGLKDPRGLRLVLRGALPHAPTEMERDLMLRVNSLLEEGELEEEELVRLTSGGSWVWCAAGCFVCGTGCLACCTIIL